MNVFAFDCETALIQPGLLAPPLVCLTYKTLAGERKILGWRDAVPLFMRVLESDAHVVGHNIPFDLCVVLEEARQSFPSLYKPMLRRVFERYDAGRFGDTIIRQQLIDIAQGNRKFWTGAAEDGSSIPVRSDYSLEALAKRLLARILEKTTWRLKYAELRDVPVDRWPKGAIDYAMTDADVALDVWLHQKKTADDYYVDEYSLVNEHQQMQAQFSLHLTTAWGLRTDPAAVAQLEQHLIADRTAVRAQLAASGIYRADGTKDMKVLRGLVEAGYARQGDKAPMTAGSESRAPVVQTSEDALLGAKDPVLDAFASIGETEKLLSSFVPVLKLGSVGPVQPNYVTLVETGRTSAFQPNIQQLPRRGGVRECFVSRPGRLYCSVDYDVAELRALGQLTYDFGFKVHTLAEALNAGLDPHIDVASKLLAIPYETAVKRLKEEQAGVKAGKLTPGPDTTPMMDRRQIAKILNFGLPGGLGATTFVGYAAGYGVTISADEARRLKANWLTAWPEMKEYFDMVARLCDHDGMAPWVEHPLSMRRRGYVRYTSCANGFFQGRTADAAKAALYAVVRECYLEHLRSPLYGSRPVVFLHDEVICEVPESRATEAAERQAQVMCDAAQVWHPQVRMTASPALMRRWFKDAKEVRDPNTKELLPWEPEPKKAAA